MLSREMPVDSDALRANIDGTTRRVEIPDRYAPLVQAVEGLYGVRMRLLETLQEFFHEYRNIEAVIEGFQTVLLRNWMYFEGSANRGLLFALLAELLMELLRQPLTREQTSSLLRQLFMWVGTCLSSRHSHEYREAILALLGTLTDTAGREPLSLLERDSLLREMINKAAADPYLSEAALELYRMVLVSGYGIVMDRLKIVEWCHQPDTELNRPGEVVEGFSFLTGSRMEKLAEAAGKADPAELLSDEFPTFSQLIDRSIAGVFRVKNLEDRFLVCLYFLKDDTLGNRQNEVMSDLLGVVRIMMEPVRKYDVERVLSSLTRFFRNRSAAFLFTRFQCYESIGTAIGIAGNARAADHLIEDILYWNFQYPDIRGATDDWETVVNPFHLPKIRCWMRIIESNPALYEKLAAALNVQLRLGGVYIADTDLFQRDITRFLNADISPIYFVAKQLLRTFPVYFNEVGAEGELRSVSTRIDELCHRHDSLMHFLRKQVHAEASNRIVAFCGAVILYWTTLDTSCLEPFLSPNVLADVRMERQWAEGPHGVISALKRRGETSEDLAVRVLSMKQEEFETSSGEAPGNPGFNSNRVALMVRLNQLLVRKYTPSADSLDDLVGGCLALDSVTRENFTGTLAAWARHPDQPRRDALLDASLTVLERLKEIILDPAHSEGVENIYHKRHIAAGIPSMYGDYSEPKFDALGLSFRIEGLVGTLFEDVASGPDSPFMNRSSLKRVAAELQRFERALALDGVNPRSLSSNIRMLEASFAWHNITFNQYRNIFQFLAQSVTELSRASILSHDRILRTVLEHDPRQCALRGLCIDAVSEMVLREVLVSALGLQTLDRYVGDRYRLISELTGELSPEALTRMMNYDADCLISHLGEKLPNTDDQMTLGHKGLGLKHIAMHGHNVPDCFIITTELFAALPAMTYAPLYNDTLARIRRAVERLEERTGLQLGNPERPLMLAIRSGAAFSMPGLMTTFVNVGLNDELAEKLSQREDRSWTVWDSYRRFIQIWAMSSGVARDVFDGIMKEFKARFGVTLKLEFTPEQMREMALKYRRRAEELGVRFIDDPFEQVIACVQRVLDSWNSHHASYYRSYVGIAEEWGTAVVVQRMVYGNRDRHSGSGVTFTRNPREPYSRQVRLFGDFTVCSQGEDLVGGLVFPSPISEAQRKSNPTYSHIDGSLEKNYPEVYGALLAVADDLASRDYDPQEIEFTFESPSADDLFILQKRVMVAESTSDVQVFRHMLEGSLEPVAVGIGVAGGAYSGRVAVNQEQIDALLEECPDENIVLLRPDTVPEDIAMITRVQGILTARGGSTSHAAVTAKRLGKTAVVDCNQLEVLEHQGMARISGNELGTGEWISIDGRTGRIFLGRLETITQP
jgi:pyruvate,orthophosphate dikinase